MIEINTLQEMNQWTQSKKKEGYNIGFVPTMGFLHEGHLSLIKRAQQKSDYIVMSVFVNPLQFGEGEDFQDYPRDKKRDKALAEKHGVDVFFYPRIEEMYPRPMSVSLNVHHGVDVLCGASRPGHFDGVATVVMKLFQIIQPDKAFFGMKDAQQVSVIQRMVNDFHFNIEIIPVEIIRENDGLAKSSRNVNLTISERKEAPKIYETIKKAKQLAKDKQMTSAAELELWTIEQLKVQLSGRIDYVQVLRFPDLTAIDKLEGKIILAVAVHYERARLIDNITWKQN
ncbi:pantoate--beta-alanine ligase [Salipaludibacillus daqingensis]|uniref:pantoate--beta-alanine ligase n=1 Tax=Salipaludibacillus daqingensis TaxID=3041001 RepID=UPI0024739479|nr:pantoate--beta-alanine ligase [Salipaludibacillus daqingensis]